MERQFITCRFRKELDRDLVEATKDLTSGELSELVRNGLRIMLGIRTSRKMEVVERQLIVPEIKERTAQSKLPVHRPYKPKS